MSEKQSFSGPNPELASARTGIGLRPPHMAEVASSKPQTGFLEAHSENYFRIGSRPFEDLLECREHYPVSLHGVGLSLGSADGVSKEHLQKLKILADILDPAMVSEHLSWSSYNGRSVPDLLPLPMTEEALKVICANIDHVQEFLNRVILVENPSSYLAFEHADMSETDFIAEAAKRTGCGLLLDVNNIAVSAHNMNFDAKAYLDALPQNIVGEYHLAGYQVNDADGHEIFIDAHNHPVYDTVWELYRHALSRFGDAPTLVEWDADIPPLARLLAEAKKADAIRDEARGGGANAKLA